MSNRIEVQGWPSYQVDDGGNVYRLQTGRRLKPYVDGDGYRMVTLYNGSRESKTYIKIAVVVLTAFHGPKPDGKESCHRDGNPGNDRADNLYWGTKTENAMDALRHGTRVRNMGTDNGRAKLNDWEALDIYDRSWSGESLVSIAEEYGLHPEYVRLIKKGKYWSHVYALVI